MITNEMIRSVRAGALMALLLVTACSDFFNVPNSNQPNLEDLVNNPTRTKLSAAATGIFAGARSGIQSYIWRLGSMGREGINLSGNNQPDYQEPYFGPLQSTGFGGAQWTDRYQNIRNINVYLNALARISNTEVADGEKAAGRGMANTLKALAFTYVILTRDTLGAPIDVDHPITDAPAPFVSRDSVYKHIIGLLDSAQADLGRATAASADFPFPIPPGLASFATPATFVQFNRALAAKAEVLRASAAGCGAPCYTQALTDLAGSFLVVDSASLGNGAMFDFSTAPGDATNGLSEPLNGVTFYAHPADTADAQQQPGGSPDQRVLDKLATAEVVQVLGGISIHGEQKFTMYFTGGKPDPNHAIPIIRNEELILLRAEAEWFASAPNKAQAIVDLDFVRQNAGGLAPTTVTIVSQDSDFVKELIYNRRYSLLWEQGSRWIDARRFNRLADIINEVPSFPSVPKVMPLPKAECDARGFATNCTPLNP
ncbi:MAG TPA: RagB/SusD family nutrient uptake outer membrane protein [Gemmatimonadales bacterium]|jgi:hypothetical protein